MTEEELRKIIENHILWMLEKTEIDHTADGYIENAAFTGYSPLLDLMKNDDGKFDKDDWEATLAKLGIDPNDVKVGRDIVHDGGISFHTEPYMMLGEKRISATDFNNLIYDSYKKALSEYNANETQETTYVVVYDPTQYSQHIFNELNRGNDKVLAISTNEITSPEYLANIIENQSGKVELILANHGHQGASGLYGIDSSISYAALFSAMPKNLTAILNFSCHSESSVDYIDFLPPGTLVFAHVGEMYSTITSVTAVTSTEIVSSKIVNPELEVIDNALQEDGFNLAGDSNHYENVVDLNTRYFGKEELKTNPGDIFPDRFGISGYGIVDLDEQISNFINPANPYQIISDTTISEVAGAFEGMKEEDIRTIAEKIQNGSYNTANGFNIPFNEVQVAYGLMLTHLETTGQIRDWQAQAIQHPVFDKDPNKIVERIKLFTHNTMASGDPDGDSFRQIMIQKYSSGSPEENQLFNDYFDRYSDFRNKKMDFYRQFADTSHSHIRSKIETFCDSPEWSDPSKQAAMRQEILKAIPNTPKAIDLFNNIIAARQALDDAEQALGKEYIYSRTAIPTANHELDEDYTNSVSQAIYSDKTSSGYIRHN